jgi:hypothetical protein
MTYYDTLFQEPKWNAAGDACMSQSDIYTLIKKHKIGVATSGIMLI